MKRRKGSWKLKLTPEKLDEIAASVNDDHRRDVKDGYRLTGHSGVWRKKDGSFTIVLVYQKSRAFTKTVSFRNVRAAG